MSCCKGLRRCSDLALLWHRPAATAPIRLLAWESPYAVGAALEKTKRQKNKTKQKQQQQKNYSTFIGNMRKLL